MSTASAAQLQRNIYLQVVIRIFQKRVFLPLAPIYFTVVGGLSLQELGLLAMWFAAVQVLVEIPTGVIADKFGKVRSERYGALFNICSTALFVLMPNHTGIFAGIALEAIGYSFFGGASEALLHDTLEAQGRVKQYTKVLSRIQSASLAVNAVLVSLVPLTYRINPAYPFILGALAYTVLFVTTFFLAEVYPPGRTKVPISHYLLPIIPRWSQVKRYKKYGLFFASFGLLSALYTGPTDFVTLALRDLGMRPETLGVLLGAASLVGVVVGWFIHLFKRFPFYVYALVDWGFLFIWLGVVWLGQLSILVVTYVLTMAFWRYRRIIYQEKILKILGTNQKATALSVMNNATQVNEFYVPLLFGAGAAAFGIQTTFGLATIVSLGLLLVWIAAIRTIPSAPVPKAPIIPEDIPISTKM